MRVFVDVCVWYLTHVLLAHAKLVVAQQERPHLLPDVVLHSSIIHQPQQLQLLVVLHTHTHKYKGSTGIIKEDKPVIKGHGVLTVGERIITTLLKRL